MGEKVHVNAFPAAVGDCAQPLADPELEFRGHMASAEREPITGVWGRSPQRGPGTEPLIRGSGELKAFWPSDVQRTQQICTLGPLQYFQFKASYSNLNP